MNSNTIALLAAALFGFFAGVILLWVSLRNGAKNFGMINPTCWLMVPLFPLLLIFYFFPTSTAEGTVLGIKIGSAFAGYVLLWMMGVRWTKQAFESKLRADLKVANVTIATSEAALKEATLKNAEAGPGATELLETKRYLYALKGKRGKSIGLVTGNIRNIDFADIWVSSENTNMEMARHFDRGVSATIRFLGSKRDGEGVIEDSVADELNAVLIAKGLKVERRMKTGDPGSVEVKSKTPNVLAGTVLVTGAGELQTSHNVQKILHVATVRGDPDGEGYHQVPKIETCVTNTLDEVKRLNNPAYKTILFPLLGTGVGGANVKDTARRLIVAATSYLEAKDLGIETLYFIARTNLDLQRCQEIFAEAALADRVTAPKS